jgi:hypothetical protein
MAPLVAFKRLIVSAPLEIPRSGRLRRRVSRNAEAAMNNP